jgi:hypothetical protein
MVEIELIEGTLEAVGGYCINGKQHIGDKHEALVDEAKQIAYATGRKMEEVIIHIMPTNSADDSEEVTP